MSDTKTIVIAEPRQPILSADVLDDFLQKAADFQADRARLLPYWIDAGKRHPAVVAGLKLSVAVGGPNGLQRPTHKAIEASGAVKQGVDDVLLTLPTDGLKPRLDQLDRTQLLGEIREMLRAIRAAGPATTVGIAWPMGIDSPDESVVGTWCDFLRQAGCDYLRLPAAVSATHDFLETEQATSKPVKMLQRSSV